jgi:hypothetical protein
MSLVRVATFCSALIIATSVGNAADPEPVRVFLKPAVEAGQLIIGDEVKGRVDSTTDLAAALKGKKKTLALVDDPATAQLTVEVIERSEVGLGKQQRNTVTGTLDEKKGRRVTARITTAAGQSGDVSYTSEGEILMWRNATIGLAGKIDSWIKENRAALQR